MNNEYLEFKVDNRERFGMLKKFFDRLKVDKDGEQIAEHEAYLRYIDDEAREYFWWPTDEEYSAWLKRWFATPLDTRRSDSSLRIGWLFEAMILALESGDYELISCELKEEGTGRLEFYSLAYPYGGTGAMQALIECFGFEVTEIFDGASPPRKP